MDAGDIEFTDPRTSHVMIQPSFELGKQRSKEYWTKVRFTPKAGKMLIFPSWLYHGVDPNMSGKTGKDGERVIISSNVSNGLIMAKLRVDRIIEADRQKVCNLARLAHGESLFADIPFSEAKFFKAFDNTLHEPGTYLSLKVSLAEKIVGFCYALLGGYYIGEDAKVVTVITIAIAPETRSRLLGGKAALHLTHGIEIWAKGMGASYILYHATSGTNPTNSDRFFQKLGMTTLGGNYGARLNGESGISG